MPLTDANATTASVKARRRRAPSGSPAGPQVFLDGDNGFGAGKAPREMSHIALQQGHFRHKRLGSGGLRATLDRRQRAESAGVALSAPVTQCRRVETLAAQDRTDPPGFGGAVGLGEDAQLVPRGERPSARTGG